MSETAPIYLDPEFWIAVTFCCTLFLLFKPVSKALAKMLDSRSAQIAAELAEAKKLRAEAEEILAAYKARQEKSLHEAEEILNSTKINAARMAEQAETDLKTALEKRMKLATDKIAQAEAKALQDVQAHVVDVAVAAARTIINDHLIRTGNGDIVQQAAAELSRRLH